MQLCEHDRVSSMLMRNYIVMRRIGACSTINTVPIPLFAKFGSLFKLYERNRLRPLSNR
jgi:hypothetical protein